GQHESNQDRTPESPGDVLPECEAKLSQYIGRQEQEIADQHRYEGSKRDSRHSEKVHEAEAEHRVGNRFTNLQLGEKRNLVRTEQQLPADALHEPWQLPDYQDRKYYVASHPPVAGHVLRPEPQANEGRSEREQVNSERNCEGGRMPDSIQVQLAQSLVVARGV